MRTTPPFFPGLVLALALAACGDEGTTAPPRDATPPVLEVLAPVSPDSVVLARPVQVRARCREDDAGGCSVEVYLQGGLVAQGVDSVNTMVSLAEHVDRSVRFTFVAVNRSGGRTTTETAEFRVISSRLTEVASLTVEGRLLDIAPDRVVYVRGDFVIVRTVSTGEERMVFAESTARNTTAWLFPGGVLLSLNGGSFKPNGMREIGGSGAWTLPGYGVGVSGRWVTWLVDQGVQVIHRDDAVARRFTTAPLPADKAVDSYSVAEDGTIVLALRPRAAPGGDPSGKTQLYRLREAAVEQITFDTTAAALFPSTDGANVVYTRRTSTADGERSQTMLLTPAGEQALSAPGPAGYGYRAVGGWVAFTLPDAAGVRQGWTRSPAGELRQVTSGATPGSVTLGPDLQMVVWTGDRMYFARTPTGALVDIGPTLPGGPVWYHGDPDMYFHATGRLLRLDF